VQESLLPYLDFLRRHGVDFDLAGEVHRDADHDGDPHADPREVRPLELEGLPGLEEERRPGSALGADHATRSVILAMQRCALVRPGSTFVDMGCGTGVLALAAAQMGAGRVVASDVDPDAVELTRRNARRGGFEVEAHEGPLLEPVPADVRLELVAANLPHKPRRRAGELPLAQDGGEDGVELLGAFFEQFAERGRAGDRVVFFLHSLAHPRLLAALAGRFRLTLLAWKRRLLGPGEYGDLQGWFQERARRDLCFIAESDGRRHLVACVWLAELLPLHSG